MKNLLQVFVSLFGITGLFWAQVGWAAPHLNCRVQKINSDRKSMLDPKHTRTHALIREIEGSKIARVEFSNREFEYRVALNGDDVKIFFLNKETQKGASVNAKAADLATKGISLRLPAEEVNSPSNSTIDLTCHQD